MRVTALAALCLLGLGVVAVRGAADATSAGDGIQMLKLSRKKAEIDSNRALLNAFDFVGQPQLVQGELSATVDWHFCCH
jgi:hypothetical protein